MNGADSITTRRVLCLLQDVLIRSKEFSYVHALVEFHSCDSNDYQPGVFANTLPVISRPVPT